MSVDYIALARRNRENALANRTQSRSLFAVNSDSRLHSKAGGRHVDAIFTSRRGTGQIIQFIA